MKGAYGVFGVTDCAFNESPLTIETTNGHTVWTAFLEEEQQGKDMIDAAKHAGVKHFVWTTLDYSEWHVPHFETKARANDYLIASGLPRTSYVRLLVFSRHISLTTRLRAASTSPISSKT